jgi:serine protease AprX
MLGVVDQITPNNPLGGMMMTKLQKPIQILIALVLMVSLLTPAVLTASPAPVRMSSSLAEMVAGNPDGTLRIIVQKAGVTDRTEYLVKRWGGRVLKDLPIINAFAAELPARSVPRLARLQDVNWVSLDARVVPAAKPVAFTPDFTFRDEFNSGSYSGNDGGRAWTGDWQEVSESNGPDSGRVRVRSSYRCASGDCLRIGGDEVSLDNHGVTRSADLRGAVSAQLSFSYRRDIEEDGGELYPMVSNDGGATWVGLDGISLWYARDWDQIYASYDISYILPATEIQVRFAVNSNELEGYVYIDDVQLGYVLEANTYPQTLNLEKLHANGITGAGVTVAVIDSGIGRHPDLAKRLILPSEDSLYLTSDAALQYYGVGDFYGHGTHVAGIIGGDGSASAGHYTGVAPGANFISLGVSDEFGMAYESDVVDALQWVNDHMDQYNIRVVNLSLNSVVEDSYHNSGIDAAVEILWLKGVVVVASVGNKGPAGGHNTAKTAPANDPFIIVVGASDEHTTGDPGDDTIAPFSSHGTTADGFERPDIIAPGYNIISALSPDSAWDEEHPERVGFGGQYIRLSGTSMSAPMVTGAVALLLQDEPDLTPDQVKYRLLNTGPDIGGYPYLDIVAAVYGTTTESAYTGFMPHMLLAKMALIAYWASENGGEDVDWANVDWEAVNWDSVNWNAVNWNAVNWNAVNWNAVNWNAVNWNAVNWNAVNWNAVNWNAVNWNAVNWNAVNWNAVHLDGVFWGKGPKKNK